MKKRQPFSPRFLAAQTAGSMRMEGFVVSSEREELLAAIIAGDVDSEQIRREAIRKHTERARRLNEAQDATLGL